MKSRLALLPVTALALVLGGAAVAPGAFAQAAPAAAPAGPMRHGRDGAHIEGHIAFLKAELRITPAQEALFAKVADAMRADVADITAQRAKWDGRPPTAVQELEARAGFAAERAKSEERFLGVFRPLYEALSAEQKLTADDLMARGRGY
jgi:hypothetical protein